jgi:hypothetical protein
VKAFMLSSLAFAAGCSGRIVGDERGYWLPATTALGLETSPAISYAGSDGNLPFGFTASGYYALPTDIPSEVSQKEARVTSLILQSLAQSVFDFNHPSVKTMIADDAVLYMTNMDAWPDAFFSQNFGRAYHIQILDADGDKLSDCGGGNCSITDIVVIKNRGFNPTTDKLSGLSPAEAGELAKLVTLASEEEASNYWLDAMNDAQRSAYIAQIVELWKAASSGRDDDEVLAAAWTKGGIPFALDESGLKNYALRPSLTQAIAARYPHASSAERNEMEVALVSALQLIGEHASSLIGVPGKCYYDYYRTCDEAEGKPAKTYADYRAEFVRRESFSHIVRRGENRSVYPSFLRNYFEGAYLKAHLDRQFNDGLAAGAAIQHNPYLADYDTLLKLIKDVIPAMIALEP